MSEQVTREREERILKMRRAEMSFTEIAAQEHLSRTYAQKVCSRGMPAKEYKHWADLIRRHNKESADKKSVKGRKHQAEMNMTAAKGLGVKW